MRGVALAVCLAAMPMFAAATHPPDPKTIIKRSVAANEHDFKLAPKYSYFVKDTTEQLDSNGHVTSQTVKTHEVLMIEGSPYRRLVEVNGRPVSPQEQQTEQQKLQKAILKRRNESKQERQARISKYRADRKRDQIMMRQLTKAMNFTLAGEAVLNGYPVWVLNATPRPGYNPPNNQAKVLTGMQGKLWIGKKNYQWVKVEAEVVHPVSIEGFLAKVEPGTRFELEKRPVGDGVWLPSHFAMRASYTTLFFFSHNNAEEETYYNYKPVAAVETANRMD